MALTEIAGGLAGATPYGALAGAAGQVLSSALEDKPSNTTSGAGNYQSGPFTVGNKQVGGKGNSTGGTSASAAQTPVSERPGEVPMNPRTQTTLYIVIGSAVLLIVATLLFTLRPRRRR